MALRFPVHVSGLMRRLRGDRASWLVDHNVVMVRRGVIDAECHTSTITHPPWGRSHGVNRDGQARARQRSGLPSINRLPAGRTKRPVVSERAAQVVAKLPGARHAR